MGTRYATICACASLLVFAMSMTVMGPAVGAMAETYAVEPGRLGMLVTSLSLGFIAAVSLAGIVMDRLPLRPLFIAGQAAVALSLGGIALSARIEAGLAWFLLLGLGGGLVQISANTLVASVNPESRASSLTFLHIFYGTGALAGPLVAGSLLEKGFPWPTIYFFLAGLAAAVALLILPARFPRLHREPGVSFTGLLKNGHVLLVSLAAVLYVGIEMGINSWAVLYLERVLSMEKLSASSVLSYFWFFITFGRLLCMRLARRMRAGTLLVILSAGGALSFALFYATGRGAVAGIALSLVGLFFSGIFPLLISLGSDAFPGRIGGVTGILLTSLGVGLMIFPWAAGEIGARWSLSTGMLFLAGIHAALVAVSWALARRGRTL